jgi:hypothetical protein
MSITHDDVARVLKEAEIEAKKVARQQLKTEGVQAKVLEKHRQAEDMIDQLAKANAARRAAALEKFTTTTLSEPCVWPSIEKCMEHYEMCRLKNVWISWPPGNPRWVMPECYPVPPHSQHGSLCCPMCIAKFWAACYHEAGINTIEHS